MAKFKMKLKITGFELEIQGERDEVPQLAHNVQEQMRALLTPAIDLNDAEIIPTTTAAPAGTPEPKGKRRRGSRPVKKTTTTATDSSVGVVHTWTHDPARWGNPLQTWSTRLRALWLLYVVKNELAVSQLSTYDIVETFNKHFFEAKTIRVQNVNRDLAVAKSKNKSEVGEDTTTHPSRWFLTQEGEKVAAKLITELLNTPPSIL